MSRDRIAWWLLGLVVVSAAAMLLVETRPAASASALSVGSRGLFVARRYLEERGSEVTLLDRPLGEAEPARVLVLAFPWQRWASRGERAGIQQHLLAGGTLVLAYSGEDVSRGEQQVMDWLGLSWEKLRGEPPLGFFAWRAFANEEWNLNPDESLDSLPLRVSAFSHAPQVPAGATVLYYGPEEEPVAFLYEYLNGLVVVLPSEVFSNARILREGNADLLESLRSSLGASWSFDEYHHGLSAPLTPEQEWPRFAFDLFLLHIAVIYALVVFCLAKPFGPVWSERPVVTGSTRTFLLGLGSLHDRLGHHGEAAELLVQRIRDLEPRVELQETGTVQSGAELVALGTRVTRNPAK
jgi:hypothetical protein